MNRGRTSPRRRLVAVSSGGHRAGRMGYEFFTHNTTSYVVDRVIWGRTLGGCPVRAPRLRGTRRYVMVSTPGPSNPVRVDRRVAPSSGASGSLLRHGDDRPDGGSHECGSLGHCRSGVVCAGVCRCARLLCARRRDGGGPIEGHRARYVAHDVAGVGPDARRGAPRPARRRVWAQLRGGRRGGTTHDGCDRRP